MKLIEYNGEQHYKKMGFGGDSEAHFERAKNMDKIKADWCLDNNIPLLVIPYTKFKEVDSILDEFMERCRVEPSGKAGVYPSSPYDQRQ